LVLGIASLFSADQLAALIAATSFAAGLNVYATVGRRVTAARTVPTDPALLDAAAGGKMGAVGLLVGAGMRTNRARADVLAQDHGPLARPAGRWQESRWSRASPR